MSIHKLKGSTLNFTQSEIIQELAELEKNLFSSQILSQNQSVVDDLKMKYKELCDELDLVAESWKESSFTN